MSVYWIWVYALIVQQLISKNNKILNKGPVKFRENVEKVNFQLCFGQKFIQKSLRLDSVLIVLF